MLNLYELQCWLCLRIVDTQEDYDEVHFLCGFCLFCTGLKTFRIWKWQFILILSVCKSNIDGHQICLSAPVTINDDSSGLTDVDVQEIRNLLKDTEGLSSKAMDDFMEIINKFRKDSSYEVLAEGIVSNFVFDFYER